jgi:hypothetical protein
MTKRKRNHKPTVGKFIGAEDKPKTGAQWVGRQTQQKKLQEQAPVQVYSSDLRMGLWALLGLFPQHSRS